MTSATEVLRRMLDERGVEQRTYGTTDRTWFEVGNISWFVIERENGNLTADAVLLTPEQAIEVTLGAGTCHDVGGTGASDEQVFNCSECGCVLSLYDSDGTNTLCTRFIHDYPRYCPECGRKVVDE